VELTGDVVCLTASQRLRMQESRRIRPEGGKPVAGRGEGAIRE
jgi:hypothetical protein